MNELHGKLIGRDKEFKLMGDKLTPLLIVTRRNENRTLFYIEDLVVNTFFKLLRKRSERFPGAYINHYSFDSQIATFLIDGSKSEHEVLACLKERSSQVYINCFYHCVYQHTGFFSMLIQEK
ncbi:uncharacterized protein LOC120152691 [Hibiscus syriacus]|uniref:uncharacterized protein LOC120152691 n=1 Tax=Hibiscus syriacus TaxID=106335 RepID=UPI001921753F|nr:uncharacterized protein LOC120152691 [Hibiscus syriacus]